MKNKLALFGGKPIVYRHKSLRVNWPITSKNDFNAIKGVFERREFSGRGSREVSLFEKEFSSYFGDLYATALNSGTAALHTALVALNIKPNDEVIVPALSFVSSALAIIHNHSIPIFADIDPNTYNISPRSIADKITRKTKAVIVVHLHGFPAAVKEIKSLCKRFDLKLIEDVAQAPGARINGKLLGTFGDASIFSLMSQKNLGTCGECGVLLTKTLDSKNKAEMTRIYGEILRGKERLYNSLTLGWNYTLNPIQAAMARTQLRRFPETTRKIQIAGRIFTKALKKFKWVIPQQEGSGEEAVFHFYRIRLDPSVFSYLRKGRFRKSIQDALCAEGLNVRLYQNTPLPGHPIFANKNKFSGEIPWSCANSNVAYSIYDYPNTLDVIRSTVIIGGIGSTPGYLLCPGTTEKYINGFQKIEENMGDLLKYADKIKYKEPWEEAAMISDSFETNYTLKE